MAQPEAPSFPESVSDPSFLPAFADAENRALAAQCQALRAELRAFDAQLLDDTDTIGVLCKHVSTGLAQVDAASSTLAVKSQQFGEKEHRQQLALRNLEALTRELLALEEEGREAASRLERIESDRRKHTRLLEVFSNAQSWSEAQLQQWAGLAAEREEDNLALQAYGRQDEEAIKHLNKELLKASQDALDAEREAAAAKTDCSIAAAELDAQMDAVLQCEKEQQDVLCQLQDARRNAERQGAEQTEAEQRRAAQQAALQAALVEQHEQTKAMQRERAEIAKVEASVGAAERAASKSRDLLSQRRAEVQRLADAVDLKAADVTDIRHEADSLNKSAHLSGLQMEEIRRRIRALEAEENEIDSALEQRRHVQSSLAADAQQLESLLKVESTRLDVAAEDEAAATRSRVGEGDKLRQLQDDFRILQSSLTSLATQKRGAAAKLHDIDFHALQEEELLYKTRFRLAMLEREADEIAGCRSSSESEILSEVIRKLKNELDRAKVEAEKLATHARVAAEELARQRKQATDQAASTSELLHATASSQAEGDAVERQVVSLVKEREALLVARDVLGVDLLKRRGLTLSKADSVARLEKELEAERMELQSRLHACQADRASLLVDLRLAREDSSRLQQELGRRILVRKKLEARLETIRLKKASDPDDSSQAETAIHGLEELAALQEKALQEQARVRQAVGGTAVLEQALTDANAANLDFCTHVRCQPERMANEIEREKATDELLRVQLREATEQLAHLAAQKKHLSEAHEEALGRIEVLTTAVADGQSDFEAIQQRKVNMEAWTRSQEEKIKRARRRASQASAAAERQGADVTLREREVELALLTETNRKVSKEIASLLRTAGDQHLTDAAPVFVTNASTS